MKLNFKSFGEGEPLIILHGLMGMLDNWQTLAKYYAEEFEVFILDARNHGHSPHDPEMNYEVMMYDLLEFCHDHALSNANFLGHSMGGKTVMKFAQNYPEFVEKLIVADIAPKAYPPHHQKILEGLSTIDFDEQTSRGAIDKHLQQFIPEPGVRQFLLKSTYWESKGKLGLRFNLSSIKNNIDVIGEEVSDGQFDGDVLFIRGLNSKYIQDEDLPQIHQLFPNSKLESIENAGHWLHAEQPQEFLDKTLSFLTN